MNSLFFVLIQLFTAKSTEKKLSDYFKIHFELMNKIYLPSGSAKMLGNGLDK